LAEGGVGHVSPCSNAVMAQRMDGTMAQGRRGVEGGGIAASSGMCVALPAKSPPPRELDLEDDFDFVSDDGGVPREVEARSGEGRARREANRVAPLVEHGAGRGAIIDDIEDDGLGDAHEGEVAGDAAGALACRLDGGGGEDDLGEILALKQV